MQGLDASDIRTDGRTDLESLQQFVTETERDIIALPTESLDAILTELEDNSERIRELEETDDDQDARMDALGSGIESAHDDLADHDDRLTEIEEDNSGGEHTEDTPPATKIEQLASLSDDILDEELHENQQRSVEVARRIMDYAKSTPAGRVIDAAAIRDVLRDIESESTHTETVSRIRDFLVKFGEGTIKQVERRGKQLLAVDDDLARRLGSSRRGDRTGDGG